MSKLNYPTLLDVAKLDAGSGYPVIDETIAAYPEMEVVPAATMEGATMELSVLTTLPTVGFRYANQGSVNTPPKFDNKVFQTAIIETIIGVDWQGVLKASKDQARFLINQSKPYMKAVMSWLSQQFYYGTGNDVKGFPGLIAQSSPDTAHVIDAGGTANKTSVWLLQTGTENFEWLFGNNQTLVMGNDWTPPKVIRDDQGLPFIGIENWITGRAGLRLANKNACIRIKNVDLTHPLNDALLGQAMLLAELLGMSPTIIMANPRSLEQLRVSRTTYNPAGAPVPRPVDYMGIPFKPTINISTNETY